MRPSIPGEKERTTSGFRFWTSRVNRIFIRRVTSQQTVIDSSDELGWNLIKPNRLYSHQHVLFPSLLLLLVLLLSLHFSFATCFFSACPIFLSSHKQRRKSFFANPIDKIKSHFPPGSHYRPVIWRVLYWTTSAKASVVLVIIARASSASSERISSTATAARSTEPRAREPHDV